MIAELRQTLMRTERFALACPVLFAVPIAIELIQHAGEMHVGFYDSFAAMKVSDDAPLRMTLGHFKVMVLMIAQYWTLRFLAFGEDARAATHVDSGVARTYFPVILWGVFWLVALQDGPAIAAALGADLRIATLVMFAVMLMSIVLEPVLSLWKVAAAAGNPAIDFRRAIVLSRGNRWWAAGFTLLVVLPLMVVHYALAVLAIGKGPATTWTILIADSLLVGAMAVAMPAITYAIADRMATRRAVKIVDPDIHRACQSCPA